VNVSGEDPDIVDGEPNGECSEVGEPVAGRQTTNNKMQLSAMNRIGCVVTASVVVGQSSI
jgi:hypothetical protein